MTNENSLPRNKMTQKKISSSSGGIIACVIMMQHMKEVAVAVLACSNGFFGKYVVVMCFCMIVVM